MADKIIMYTTPWCGDCRRAKAVFKSVGVEFEEVDISDNPEATAYVERVNRGYRSVPTIVFPDGEIMVEPSSHELTKKLRSLCA